MGGLLRCRAGAGAAQGTARVIGSREAAPASKWQAAGPMILYTVTFAKSARKELEALARALIPRNGSKPWRLTLDLRAAGNWSGKATSGASGLLQSRMREVLLPQA